MAPIGNDAARRKAINEYMAAIEFKESAIEDVLKEETQQEKLQNDYLVKYVEVKREDAATDLIMTCDRELIYPGALLVVNRSLGTAVPTVSVLPRGKVKITLDPGSLNLLSGNSREVQPDSWKNLSHPVNAAINEMVDDFRKSKKDMLANFIDHTSSGQSIEELKINASCSGGFAGITASASINVDKKSYSTYYMTDFSQVIYTASASFDQRDFSSLFDDTVTVDQIKKSFGDGNPIIFVKTVRYGRQLYLIENLQGNSQSLIQNFDMSGYGAKAHQDYSKTTSKLSYVFRPVIRGGSVQNANIIFGDDTISRNKEETDAAFCARRVDEVRKKVNAYKRQNTTVTLTGEKFNDVNGVILSYSALRLDGANPSTAIFWRNTDHKVKKMIPNTALRVDVFNCMKDENVVASGWFTKYDDKGSELPDVYDLQKGSFSTHQKVGNVTLNLNKTNECKVTLNKVLSEGGNGRANGRVFNKAFMEPPFELPKNIYRVHLRIRSRDNNKGFYFEHEYILPCRNIMAGYLRAGKNGGEAVNWFFGGTEDHWFND